MRFSTFKTWDEVLAAARSGVRLWYHAPLDLTPRSILVLRIFKNGKIRIDPLSSGADNFTADAGHLSRFRTMERS